MTQVLERNEDILRSDPASGLGTLARETGGFLVTDGNQIGRALLAGEQFKLQTGLADEHVYAGDHAAVARPRVLDQQG